MNKKNNKIIKIRILILCTIAILLFFNYGLSRNAIDSLFLENLSSTNLPTAWLLTGISSVLIMMIYNKYNIKISLLKLFSISSLICGLILTILLICLHYKITYTTYALYIWKEIHIVLLVEIFWSFADITFSIKLAKWIYGLFMLMGSIGAITGSLMINPLVNYVGTLNSLWFLLPIFLSCYIITYIASLFIDNKVNITTKKTTIQLIQNIKLIKKSKYLFPLLGIVFITQISITFIDYEYNTFIQHAYPILDIRTGVMGKIHAILDSLSIIFQFISGLIINILKIRGTIIAIPSIVACLSLMFISIPNLTFIIITRIITKSLDYSIFKITKEILYIPLSKKEKTQGKAFIDIMMYRIGKAISSLILIWIFYFHIIKNTIYLAFSFQIIWIILAITISKRY